MSGAVQSNHAASTTLLETFGMDPAQPPQASLGSPPEAAT